MRESTFSRTYGKIRSRSTSIDAPSIAHAPRSGSALKRDKLSRANETEAARRYVDLWTIECGRVGLFFITRPCSSWTYAYLLIISFLRKPDVSLFQRESSARESGTRMKRNDREMIYHLRFKRHFLGEKMSRVTSSNCVAASDSAAFDSCWTRSKERSKRTGSLRHWYK